MVPENTEWADTLKKWGLTPANFVLKALPRNLGVLSRNDQARLARRRVAIAGMGGVGGLHLITLARAGVGAFHIADFDRFEPANFNRQYGARIPTLGRPKTDVLRADALAVNPFLDIRSFDQGINAENVDAFLDGVDLFLDGLDFFVPEVRRLVYGRAREKGIPVVTAGPIGFGTVALVFDPRGMSFDDYFDMHDGMDPFEQMLRFYVGLLSKNWLHAYAVRRFGVDLANKSGPSTPMGCLLASALAATEIVRILTGRPGLRPAPWSFQFDPYVRGLRWGRLRWGNRGPLQRLKLWVARKKLRGAKPVFRAAPAAPPWNGEGAVPPPVMEHILNAGLQAPSGDNIQPWAMSVRDGGVEIAVKQHSDPSFFNFEERAALISLGAVSENIRVAASVYGLATRLEAPGDVSRPARISFEQKRVAEDPLASILWERETNRRPHGDTPLDPQDLSAMVDAAAARGARLRWSVERKEIAALADMAYWADRARVLLRECHETLYKAFRSNIDEARRSGDGFSYGNLLVRWDQKLFLKATRPWPVMRALNALGAGNVVANASRDSMAASAAVGLLTVPDETAASVFRGGEAFERVWLTAALAGLAFQPMASLPFFWARWKSLGPEAFPPEARGHVARAMEKLRAVFPEEDFDRGGLVMLFRVGHATAIPEGTFRRPLAAFLNP